MTSCVASQQQTITGETLKGTLRGKKSCMKFNRAGIFELLSQLRNISYNAIQVNTRIIITIGMNNTHAKTNTQAGASSNSACSQVLVEAAHIDHAGNGWMIAERNFTLRRDKYNFVDGVIESLGNIQRLHVADPGSTTGMNGIANFVLAF